MQHVSKKSHLMTCLKRHTNVNLFLPKVEQAFKNLKISYKIQNFADAYHNASSSVARVALNSAELPEQACKALFDIYNIKMERIHTSFKLSEEFFRTRNANELEKYVFKAFKASTLLNLKWMNNIPVTYIKNLDKAVIAITDPEFTCEKDPYSFSIRLSCMLKIGIGVPENIRHTLLEKVCKKCPRYLKCILKSNDDCKFYYIAKEGIKND
jgi:hypothetical protein